MRSDGAGDGRLAARRPAGSPPVLHVRHRPAFALERGATLRDVTVAYETWGTLDATASNAVLLCHAWTGDSHAAGPAGRGHPAPGWWEGDGRTGPADRHRPLVRRLLQRARRMPGLDRPGVAAPGRRPARTARGSRSSRSATWCGPRPASPTTSAIARWHAVVGGSMGGMQVLEWAIMYPQRVRSIVPIATCMQATAQQIAWGAIGRRAIELDPRWRGGDYYDAEPGDGPEEGLAVARMVAQVTFRSDNVFTERFGRDSPTASATLRLWQQFEVERYLEHHGAKLGRRFDTNSYLVIGKAMDLHDVARGRGTVAGRWAGSGRRPAIGISSDLLYPNYQQRQIDELLRSEGRRQHATSRSTRRTATTPS